LCGAGHTAVFSRRAPDTGASIELKETDGAFPQPASTALLALCASRVGRRANLHSPPPAWPNCRDCAEKIAATVKSMGWVSRDVTLVAGTPRLVSDPRPRGARGGQHRQAAHDPPAGHLAQPRMFCVFRRALGA